MEIKTYKEMRVGKYLFEIIKEYRKNRNYKICKRCKTAYSKFSEVWMFQFVFRNLWLALFSQFICYIFKELLGVIGSFFKENLIFLKCPFCFNIRLNNC